ncbi:MAG: Uma2 family endonuclease [Microcystis wesenbergii Mw_QC_S_20081001_S30D]|jgi:Uma2 family endonuclease|uniref:Uma2 family endonuclease n=1 Tax=Microcystis wesenbergii Mw_QC_S_20081001_S30D TaxID=2486245 RepID=A0A552JYP6_9CHRO|nr:Uma2 family endonuclease [Microcystis aeruginosa W11-03]NCR92658.1 Uma2 family endonuclease [Microcystis aeruginosa W11-06]TRU97521.1 MAG: Uma2 family endonuclease [Microcystis wesenbergii Mw_QC_S_20081001_S30]TRV00831.1 MAG: Uma2 family endonuclease [Microcystis wesenbergii Mw_QC_S_20081001_S30D]TRV01853.1 MAG: Uma2 family endonuclease [Microcystis wesenbergii Mw_QC_B_20070930_S4D]TRV17047.1 MAG: Uma2 family endonuclease [Microcystis wesenbergii Mw_QC_B_20070930_S4]
MVSQLDKTNVTEIIYPDSDSQPMADNTLQFRWITTIKTNLDWLFRDQSDVFVAGDLLWYPVENENKLRQAPDIMVVFGRPKGERGSYRQWLENNISPQVVFEILSPGNTLTEMSKKQLFYDRYGVEEYYLYDPHKNDASGWIRGENQLEILDTLDNWVSPRLGIRFQLGEPEMLLFYPDGQAFTSYNEEKQRAAAEKQRAERLANKLRELGINPDQI